MKIVRKSLAFLLALIVLVAVTPMVSVTASAWFEENGFSYLVSGNEACIVGYSGSEKNVVIPSELGGYPLTEIADGVFKNKSFQSVLIPGNVRSIGYQAFYQCYNLREVTLEDGITSIGNGAFMYCIRLQSVHIPASVMTIAEHAFENCSSLATITAEGRVKTIMEDAFAQTAYYNNAANWQNDVLYLGEHLIAARSSIKGDCVIKNGTTLIADFAFNNCASLQSVKMADTVEEIGCCSFSGCTALETVTFSKALELVGDYSFDGCSSLSRIELPQSVQTIEYAAFRGCTSLADVVLGDGIVSFASRVFEETAYYNNEANWEDNALYVDKYLVETIAVEGEYTVKDGTRVIAGEAFGWNSLLTGVVIPDSVVTIGASAFNFCTTLSNVTFGEGIKRMEEYAFSCCYALSRVDLANAVEFIGEYAFRDCRSLSTLSLGKGIMNIAHGAFDDCNSLTDVYYARSSVEWAYISIESDNDSLKQATVHFALPSTKVYPDVKWGTWYYDAVAYVSSSGFMAGYQNGRFGPADNLQRQDFVVILARVSGADLTPYQNAEGGLVDVKAGSYYAPAVAWAVDNGIVTGYQNGKFGVGDAITREQVCTIFYRFKNKPVMENAADILSTFPDYIRISEFATDAMAWAVENRVVSGMQSGEIAPVLCASRAQIATILMRMDQNGLLLNE